MTEPDDPMQHAAPTRTGRPLLIAVAATAALVLIAAGFGVWFVMRDDKPGASSTPAAESTLNVDGTVTIELGKFSWESETNPTCQGYSSYADIQPGAQVTVTDASGKVLALGELRGGKAEGITKGSDGYARATTCVLPFTVPGIPTGVGPYGVEVAHRGVVRFDEAGLSNVRLGL